MAPSTHSSPPFNTFSLPAVRFPLQIIPSFFLPPLLSAPSSHYLQSPRNRSLWTFTSLAIFVFLTTYRTEGNKALAIFLSHLFCYLSIIFLPLLFVDMIILPPFTLFLCHIFFLPLSLISSVLLFFSGGKRRPGLLFFFYEFDSPLFLVPSGAVTSTN